MDIRMNAGYVITDSVHVGDMEFVLGVSNTAPAQFVTWACKGDDNYFWGHYQTDYIAAVRDLLARASQELELVERQQTRQIQQPQKTEKERER